MLTNSSAEFSFLPVTSCDVGRAQFHCQMRKVAISSFEGHNRSSKIKSFAFQPERGSRGAFSGHGNAKTLQMLSPMLITTGALDWRLRHRRWPCLRYLYSTG